VADAAEWFWKVQSELIQKIMTKMEALLAKRFESGFFLRAA